MRQDQNVQNDWLDRLAFPEEDTAAWTDEAKAAEFDARLRRRRRPYIIGMRLLAAAAMLTAVFVGVKQWQTHPAVDILGSPGEAVCACADGTVIDAYRDSLWGNVIVLEHADGLTSTYAGLNTLNMVTVGETVRAGETISAVGQSASCETELPAHLHFALERDGEPMALAALMPKNEE